jgi:hypothetical protein
VYVALSRRSRGDKVKDRHIDVIGCIRLFYINFIIFVVLVTKDNLIF